MQSFYTYLHHKQLPNLWVPPLPCPDSSSCPSFFLLSPSFPLPHCFPSAPPTPRSSPNSKCRSESGKYLGELSVLRRPLNPVVAPALLVGPGPHQYDADVPIWVVIFPGNRFLPLTAKEWHPRLLDLCVFPDRVTYTQMCLPPWTH